MEQYTLSEGHRETQDICKMDQYKEVKWYGTRHIQRSWIHLNKLLEKSKIQNNVYTVMPLKHILENYMQNNISCDRQIGRSIEMG